MPQERYAHVPDPAVSLVQGLPLEQEPGLGALTLSGFLREVVARHGPREAIAQPRPDGVMERWTYDDLWQRAMEVARALIACGTGKGSRVGILMTNRAEFVSTAFGAALAGGVVTAFSTFATSHELDQMITASGCSIILVEPQVVKRNVVDILCELEPEILRAAPGAIHSRRYPFLRRVVSLDTATTKGAVEAWPDFLALGMPVDDAIVRARADANSPADPGVLLFSSGSTGKPKGILSAHRGVCIQMWRMRRIFGIADGERVLTLNGFFWSGQFAMAIGGALGSGSTLVMQSHFQPEATLALYEAERVTMPMGWPHQWQQLADAANWDKVDLSSLRHVGENSPLRHHPTVRSDWQEPTRIYGNTETFTLSSAYETGTPEEVLRGAHGFPLPGMTFKVVDPLSGVTMPTGERGELAVKGATLMLGYLGVPLDETLDDEGFLPTGDGGYVDRDGRIYWEGRLNDIIKTGGANVSPVEVDARLMQYPGIKLAQTVGVPHETLGEVVVSCIVPHDGIVLDAEAIRAFAREQLASFKVPRHILFLKEAELDQTGSAKIKTAELRRLAGEQLAQVLQGPARA
ncbi:MAG: AMP-binding protein [Novosphingobium sp.]